MPHDLPKFEPFRVTKTERVYDSPWCALDRDEIELPGGELGEYHIFRIPDAVAIVPVTSQGELLMIWQHRHPHGKTHWEIPAGRTDPNESMLEAAARELEEETGHRAGRLIPLANFYPVNGISDHQAHIFLALDCEPVGELNLDNSERLVTRKRNVSEVKSALANGEFEDGFTALALFYAFASNEFPTS
ncbi:MAG: NUDIX hydrolase [Planctomycetota bacterium]|jgi:ADP-ribose pyrophosphatase|nr:NUDIX hydrolase [Planctomycetota bacterium]